MLIKKVLKMATSKKVEYATCKMGFRCIDCGLMCMCGFNSSPPCAVSPNSAITLTPSLTHHYAERSQATGKPVQALVLQDLAALHKKRVAREEKRIFRENEFERL